MASNDEKDCYFIDYIGYKVRSLCYLKNEKYQFSFHEENQTFTPFIASGSWDHHNNQISIWKYDIPLKEQMELENEINERNLSASSQREYVSYGSIQHSGDVSTLKYMKANGKDFLLSGSSNGSLHAIELNAAQSKIDMIDQTCSEWKHIVKGSFTCMDIDLDTQMIIAGSENGNLIQTSLFDPQKYDKIRGESCRIADIKFLGCETSFVVASSSPSCPLKIWDLKTNLNTATLGFEDPMIGKQYTSVFIHPTRPHLIAVGAQDGTVCIWDRRQFNAPVIYEKVHSSTVRSIQFHPTCPQFLYSSGDDGIIYSWNFDQGKSYGFHNQTPFKNGNKLEVAIQPLYRGYLPWNCMDLDGYSNTMVVGGDNDALLVYENVTKSSIVDDKPLALMP